MSPQEFQKAWIDTDDPLSPISELRLDKFNLKKDTYEFLKMTGFPKYCEPNLAFADDTDDVVYGIVRLTERYDLEEDKPYYEKYIVIGSCRDGDAIAIDTSENDKIVELDHEDLFSSSYFNSSIEALADFLILYRDFEINVIGFEEPEDSRQYYNFTNEQFEVLKSKMYAIDSKAISEEGFWKSQLEILLLLRQEEFPQ